MFTHSRQTCSIACILPCCMKLVTLRGGFPALFPSLAPQSNYVGNGCSCSLASFQPFWAASMVTASQHHCKQRFWRGAGRSPLKNFEGFYIAINDCIGILRFFHVSVQQNTHARIKLHFSLTSRSKLVVIVHRQHKARGAHALKLVQPCAARAPAGRIEHTSR